MLQGQETGPCVGVQAALGIRVLTLPFLEGPPPVELSNILNGIVEGSFVEAHENQSSSNMYTENAACKLK